MDVPTRVSLLAKLRGGQHRQAWQEFWDLYTPPLLALAHRCHLRPPHDEEAVAHTVEAVFEHFLQLEEPFDRSSRPFRAWLGRLGRNKVMDEWRALLRAPGQLGAAAAGVADEDWAADLDELEWRRSLLRRALDRVIGRTTARQWQAFQLHKLDGRPAAEVSRMLGMNENAVFIATCRVLRALRREAEELARDAE